MTNADIEPLWPACLKHAEIIAAGRLDPDECTSEAALALIEARDTWRPGRGRNLKSWAMYLVGVAIVRLIQRHAKRKGKGAS